MSKRSGLDRLRGHLVDGIGRDAQRARRRHRVVGAALAVAVVGGGGGAWFALRGSGGEPEFLATQPLTSTVEEAADDGDAAGIDLPDWQVRAVGAGPAGVVLYGDDGRSANTNAGRSTLAFLLDGSTLAWQERSPRSAYPRRSAPIRVASAATSVELAAGDGERLALLDAGIVDGRPALLVSSWVGPTMQDDESRLFLYEPRSRERRDLGFSSGWENGVSDARLVGEGLVAVLTAADLQVIDLEGVRQWGVERQSEVAMEIGVDAEGRLLVETGGETAVRDAGDGSVVGSAQPAQGLDCRGITCPVEPPASDLVDVISVPVDSSSSQSPGDVARDGVPLEIASMSYSQRVHISNEIDTPEGRWAISSTPEPGGNTPLLYGEVLLLSDDGSIIQAWPMPGFSPTWLLVADDVVYAGRIGDGAYANSAVIRIDRDTRESVAIGIQIAEGTMEVPDGWLVADDAMTAAWRAGVGDPAYGWTGEPALSTNRVVVDMNWLDRYVLVADRPEPCGRWFAPDGGALVDGVIPVALANEQPCPDAEVVGISTVPWVPTPLSMMSVPADGRLWLAPSACESETAVPTDVESVTIWLADGSSVRTQLGFEVPCYLGFVPPPQS